MNIYIFSLSPSHCKHISDLKISILCIFVNVILEVKSQITGSPLASSTFLRKNVN